MLLIVPLIAISANVDSSPFAIVPVDVISPWNLVSAVIVVPVIKFGVMLPISVSFIEPSVIVTALLNNDVPVIVRLPVTVKFCDTSTLVSKSCPVLPSLELIFPKNWPSAVIVVPVTVDGVVPPIAVPSILPASMSTVPEAPVKNDPVRTPSIPPLASMVFAITLTLLPALPKLTPSISPPVIVTLLPKLDSPDTNKFWLTDIPPVICKAPSPADAAVSPDIVVFPADTSDSVVSPPTDKSEPINATPAVVTVKLPEPTLSCEPLNVKLALSSSNPLAPANVKRVCVKFPNSKPAVIDDTFNVSLISILPSDTTLPVAPATVNTFVVTASLSTTTIPPAFELVIPVSTFSDPLTTVFPSATATLNLPPVPEPIVKSEPLNLKLLELSSLPLTPAVTISSLVRSVISVPAVNVTMSLLVNVPPITVSPVAGSTLNTESTDIPPSKLASPRTSKVDSVRTAPVPSVTVNLVPSTAIPALAFTKLLNVATPVTPNMPPTDVSLSIVAVPST